MSWPVVTPNPVPVGSTSYPAYQGLFDGVTMLLNRVTNTLASIPVLPNPEGLKDAQGNWLTPVISVLDFIIVVTLFIAFFVIFSRVSGTGGTSLFRGIFGSKDIPTVNISSAVQRQSTSYYGNGKPWLK